MSTTARHARLLDHVMRDPERRQGHAANCPRFWDTYPWKCDCRAKASNEPGLL